MNLIAKARSLELVDNWRDVLRYAWSVRIIIISGVLNALAAALDFGGLLPISPAWLFALTFVVNLGAFVARIVAQRNLSGSGK
jgi:hypothetical protein